MLIFDVTGEKVKLSLTLHGSVLKDTPDRYAFLLDYLEYAKVKNTALTCKFNTDDNYSTIISMVAGAIVAAGDEYTPYTSVLLDSPYLIGKLNEPMERISTIFLAVTDVARKAFSTDLKDMIPLMEE